MWVRASVCVMVVGQSDRCILLDLAHKHDQIVKVTTASSLLMGKAKEADP